MKEIKILKVFVVFFRVTIFVLAYILYLLQLIFIFLNLKSISRKVFSYSSYLASLALGMVYRLNKQMRKNLSKDGIHIANHDSPFDIFVAQYIFQMPTITTVKKHLEGFLPFFELSLKNYGHYNFDHLKFNERRSAYLFLNRMCFKKNNILIFPSGSIYTSINQRFSKSVLNLSIKYDLDVIAWKFFYLDYSKSNIRYETNILEYILKRFVAEETEICIENVKVFNYKEYTNFEKFYSALIQFYLP